MAKVIPRALQLPKKPDHSFFIWGPRKIGKSTLLKEFYPKALYINLLHSDLFRKYSQKPERLREEYAEHRSQFIIIDEVQKVPQLLNEVHSLIEDHNVHFCLCGSSARKLRRGHANLLGGRAIRHELFGFTMEELKDDFDLIKVLNRGVIPSHYLSVRPNALIKSYVSDYLKEEIFAESLTQNLQAFSNFLEVAALSDGQQINFSNIARESGTSNKAVAAYFQILEDTLMGRWVPVYTKNPKRRLSKSSKFYFFDVGVVNHLSKRNNIEFGSAASGYAFENWVFHELQTHLHYNDKNIDIQFWRTSVGDEVDFILNGAETAIEVKCSKNIHKGHLKGLRLFKKLHPEIKNFAVVCLENQGRVTEDGIVILPYQELYRFLGKVC